MEKLKTLIVLFKAHTSVGNNVKLSLSDSVLTLNEFAVMEALYTKGAMRTQTLAESILIPNSSLTYVLDMLVESSYVERIKDEDDKRCLLINLTKKGKKTFEEIYAKHHQHMLKIFNALSDEEELELQRLLKKLGKKAEEVYAHETSN
ncbi:MAG: MarR family transcriptional regulator [Erysipelothrix sp.]|nr:MarR family transcriptional regulator [Erysipelothrix sp.]